MTTQSTDAPQAVQDCHDLIVWLIPQLDKFPRSRRFTLGERIESRLISVLESLVEAAYSRDKRPLLRQANRQLAVARHLWRMAFELRAISSRVFEHGAGLVDSLGRQIGGWLKSQRPAETG
ncbi:MAG: diversity-generating retroelement protein Avd [Pseudomonadota bacterium]|nr:diversity-generating retroelement protein Avd [Pseudomonadota bacterium]